MFCQVSGTSHSLRASAIPDLQSLCEQQCCSVQIATSGQDLRIMSYERGSTLSLFSVLTLCFATAPANSVHVRNLFWFKLPE